MTHTGEKKEKKDSFESQNLLIPFRKFLDASTQVEDIEVPVNGSIRDYLQHHFKKTNSLSYQELWPPRKTPIGQCPILSVRADSDALNILSIHPSIIPNVCPI